LILAAIGMNGRYFRRTAARIFLDTQHFSRCERAQHKMAMAGLGSEPSFAVAILNVCFGPRLCGNSELSGVVEVSSLLQTGFGFETRVLPRLSDR
jgi:hypothetical protein